MGNVVVCKHCDKPIELDRQGEWVHVIRKQWKNRTFTSEYMEYICYSEGSGRDATLHPHMPKTFVEQHGLLELYDIERSLR